MAENPELHPAASAGFGAAAQTYVRGRPDYPEALLRWLREELGLRAGTTAVELGAGTGKFTTLLVRAGACVVAVEPVAGMRSQFSMPAAMVGGVAEAIPVRAGAADAVVCAQAFHWFATPAALREIHRVLRPAGRLGLVWNVRDQSIDWVGAITAILAPYEADTPRFASGRWREVFSQAAARGLFSEPRSISLRHEASGSPQQVIVERSLSVSFIAALPAADQARVRQRLQDLIGTHPQLRGRAQLAFPYVTHAYSCTAL